jgi:hypothetical protein
MGVAATLSATPLPPLRRLPPLGSLMEGRAPGSVAERSPSCCSASAALSAPTKRSAVER